MKILRVINNGELELSLVRALAREGLTTEHVDNPEDADVLVIFEQGKGFGVDLGEVQDLLAMDKPKAVVCINHYDAIDGGDERTAVVRPIAVGRRLKVRLSDVVAAVLRVAPPEFEIEDDTAQVEFENDLVPAPATLKDRMARALGEAGEVPRARKSVAVRGCKGGVGATTLAACLADALSELGAVHVEAAGTGWVYYGGSLEHAGGAFAAVCPEGAALAVLDGCDRGDVVVAVTDDSMMSFNCLKQAVTAGEVPDLVVINRVRGGVPESVFRTEFPGVRQFCTVVDNYKACIDAQEAGRVPTLVNPDMARDVGTLAARVREMLGL